jgi:class 3 adenylate cyclase
MKDPNQVFTLLEAVFQAFDHIAKKRGIYKVETIGDCYVGAFNGLKEHDFTSPFSHVSPFQRYAEFPHQIRNMRFRWLVSLPPP